MILDCHENYEHARAHQLFDRKTGQELKGLAIFYADDEKGFYRAYVLGIDGTPEVDPATDDLKWEEFAADFIIRRRPPGPGPLPDDAVRLSKDWRVR